MARRVNVEEYAGKRNEILHAAQMLVATKGYEQMSIQDVLDELQISKGAFYHYFDSKQALLEALADQLRARVEGTLAPIVQDPNLTAIEKLNCFLDAVGKWKSEQMHYLMSMIRVWYQDENAVIRQKVRAGAIERLSPLMAEVVHQGIHEGVFAPRYPDQAGEVVIVLIQDFNDAIARRLLVSDLQHIIMDSFEKTVGAYADALERILGAPEGALRLTAVHRLMEWLQTQQDEVVSGKGN